MKSTIVTRYSIPADKVQVIYNWGHEELKAHSDEENVFLKKYPKKSGEFRVVYAGNLGKMQNVELILETAALMKDDQDVSFYIVGGGVNEEQLKTFAKEKELNNVIFVGMQPPEEVADLYAAADVNVIPLQKGLIYAALPSKTADCLIAGKPIITCVDNGTAVEKIIRPYGIVNTGADEKRLKTAILNAKEKAGLCETKGLLEKYFSLKPNVASHCQMIEMMK